MGPDESTQVSESEVWCGSSPEESFTAFGNFLSSECSGELLFVCSGFALIWVSPYGLCCKQVLVLDGIGVDFGLIVLMETSNPLDSSGGKK